MLSSTGDKLCLARPVIFGPAQTKQGHSRDWIVRSQQSPFPGTQLQPRKRLECPLEHPQPRRTRDLPLPFSDSLGEHRIPDQMGRYGATWARLAASAFASSSAIKAMRLCSAFKSVLCRGARWSPCGHLGPVRTQAKVAVGKGLGTHGGTFWVGMIVCRIYRASALFLILHRIFCHRPQKQGGIRNRRNRSSFVIPG